jgi:hypothetical protein
MTEWQGRITSLVDSATRCIAPGNDVFTSSNIDGESQCLKEGVGEIRHSFTHGPGGAGRGSG